MTTDRIPPFHPDLNHGAGARTVRLVLGARSARQLATVAAKRCDPFLHRLIRGRLGPRLPLPFASLTTTGARSGRSRTAGVLYFNDADDVILIASNYGRDRHPSWYHNLKAHPTAVLACGGRSGSYTAVEVNDDAERTRLFALGEHVYGGFADYRQTTAAIGRRIPIMRLRPLD